MKIVVTDGHTLNPGDNPWDEVAVLGEVAIHPRTDSEEVIERCAGADILIVNKTPINADTLTRLPGLQFISMAATGYDCVDIKAAGANGIPVSNIPIYGTDTVAEYVFAAILHLSRHISSHADDVRSGEWSNCADWCFWNRPLIELRGTTIGIIGFGRIGRRVGEIATCFGMNVLAYDVYTGDMPDYKNFSWGSLDEIFQKSDFVTLHSPLTPDNHEFINAGLLGKMKPSAFLINAARGGLVNEADLAAALDKETIAGAVVDTVSTEPIGPDNPLLGAPNIYITPHLAWGTLAARKRLMDGIAANIRAFLAGQPINVVNTQFL